MLFQLLADSFFATAILLCALMYLDYALTVYGQKLYVARGRQFVEMESYELNPMWRDIVEKQLYWHPRVLYLFVRMVALAALLWLLKAASSGPGDLANAKTPRQAPGRRGGLGAGSLELRRTTQLD